MQVHTAKPSFIQLMIAFQEFGLSLKNYILPHFLVKNQIMLAQRPTLHLQNLTLHVQGNF